MSNVTFTDIIQSFTGGTTQIDVQGSNPTAPNTKGGNVLLTGGTGTGTGDGGDIILTAGTDGGTGTQGTITFSALDSTTPLPLNETGDIDLDGTFTATSIVGALNELKFSSTISNFTDLLDTPANYTGQANTLVTVNAGETGLVFNSLQSGTNNNILITTPSTVDYGVSTIGELTSRIATSDYIFLNPGTFTFTSNLALQPNTVIEGSGPSTILTRNSGFSMLTLANNCTIKNCTIDGNSQTGSALILSNVSDCEVINCEISNVSVSNCIQISSNSNNIKLLSNNFSSSTGDAIDITNPLVTNILIQNNVFNQITGLTTISTTIAENVIISNNRFISCSGLTFGSLSSNTLFSNNLLTDCTGDILVQSDNVTIANNEVHDNTDTFITCSGTNINITGNIIIGTQNNAIVSSGNNVTISDNTIITTTGTGITCTNSGFFTNITNNVIRSCTGGGIDSVSVGVIANNTMDNNGNGTGYNIDIGDFSGEVIISDNNLTGFSAATPLNINVGTGNDTTVVVKTNNARSTYSANTTITPYEDIISLIGGITALTVNDLNAASSKHEVTFNASANVTITFNSFSMFEGSITLASSEYCKAIWNGIAWKILSKSSTITTTGTRPHFNGTNTNQILSDSTTTAVRFDGNISSSSGITQLVGGSFDVPEPGYYNIQATITCISFPSNSTIFGGMSLSVSLLDLQGYTEYSSSTDVITITLVVNAVIRTTTTNIGSVLINQSTGGNYTINTLGISIIQIAPL